MFASDDYRSRLSVLVMKTARAMGNYVPGAWSCKYTDPISTWGSFVDHSWGNSGRGMMKSHIRTQEKSVKSSAFWDITPCSQLKVNRRFGWRRHAPRKRRLIFNGLHGVITQKIELFISTAVRSSNPTNSTKYFYRFRTNDTILHVFSTISFFRRVHVLTKSALQLLSLSKRLPTRLK
jgi:hypothetical protein